MKPGIEKHQAARMLDQVNRNGNPDPTRGAGEEQVKVAAEPTAAQGV
jgi:hypothetical protein